MKESLSPPEAEGDVFDQFDVQVTGELSPGGESIVAGYLCRLPLCRGQERLFESRRALIMHRIYIHLLKNSGTTKMPEEDQIRQWLRSGKPRTHEIPVMRKAWKMGKLCPVDPAVFEEFDVKGTVEDDELQYFCRLDPCKEKAVSFHNRRCWRTHRVKYHMSPEYEDGEYTLPSKEIIRDWMKAGKPLHYRPLRRVRTFITVDPPPTTSTELHNREVNPTPNNVGHEVDGQKLQVLCPLPDNQQSQGYHQGHHQEPHEVLTFGGRPSLRRSKSLARLGKLRAPTPPVEISREPRRRRGRPRKSDAAGCSSDTEPAQKKRKKERHADRSHSTVNTDSDSSDPVAIRVLATREDPSGNFYKQFMAEAATSTPDKTPPSHDPDDGTEDVDEELDHGSEGIDDLSMDQTVEDRNHDHSSADMGEFGEEPRGDMEEYGEEHREDSARQGDASPSLPSSQPESHNSGDVAEVDEDAHKEFEAPDNILPSLPELQIVKVVGHSSIQHQDFQGVSDEQQQNSTDTEMTKADGEVSEELEAPDTILPSEPELQSIVVGHSSIQPQDFEGMTDEHLQNSKTVDADEEAPKDSVASENVLPSLQNSNKEDEPDCDVIDAEMGEVEEQLESIVSPENALNALIYLQPKLLDHSSVQPQDFHGSGDLETLPNPTAEMDEVEEEAPEDSVAIENSLPSLPCLKPKFCVTGIVEHDNVLPQEFRGEMLPQTQMAEFGEAHEESIDPWKLHPSVPSDGSEQIAIPPLWRLDGDTFECLLQDLLPGKNWPNLSREDNLQTFSAETAKVGENAPEEIVATGGLSKPVQSESSEQNDLSILKHYFGDALQFSPEVSPGVLTDNLRPNSNAEMAGVSDGFVAPGNFMPWIPLVQSEGTKVPIASLKDPIDFRTVSIQDFVPCVHVNQVFVIGPNTAGMAEVGEEAPEGFTVAPDNSKPWIPLMQSEGSKLPSLERPIDNQAAPIQESVPLAHMYPVFIEAPSAAVISEVGEEALEEFAALGNLVPLLPYNSRQITGEQIHVSSLNTNASSLDPRNIQNEPIIHEYHWPPQFIHMDIADMIEPVVVLPYGPFTQPGGRGIGSTFMEGSTENSTEYQDDHIQELTVTFMDVEGSVPDFPMIDDHLWNLEEFLHVEAVALSLQPMQQLFSPGNSESSTNFPADPLLQTESSLMDMTGGLDYESNMRLQTDETDTCVQVVQRVPDLNSL